MSFHVFYSIQQLRADQLTLSDRLIVSNHLQILDVTSFGGKAVVEHWEEDDDDIVQQSLYWRQTFNHWTGRLSVSLRLSSKGCLLTHSRVKIIEDTAYVNNSTILTKRSGVAPTINVTFGSMSTVWKIAFSAKHINA
jgi:hypothetical protein